MYADKGGMDLVRKYPSTWTAWLNRKADVAVAVRLKCVEATPGLITNLPEYRETVAGAFQQTLTESTLILLLDLLNGKIYDPDEKVRAAVCKVYSHLDYEAALHHVSEEQLRALVGRGLDKKVYNTYCPLVVGHSGFSSI
jgi:sister-chromatid-cohesion protein PDS5